jgi:hypothetical protein
MQIRRRALILIAVGAVLLVSLAVFSEIDRVVTQLRIGFADDQMAIFDETLEKVARSEPSEAVDYLSYALNYYPSGTKQVPGSKLDRIVERARRSAVREMIALLRTKTGRDFGDDPQAWLDGLRSPMNR